MLSTSSREVLASVLTSLKMVKLNFAVMQRLAESLAGKLADSVTSSFVLTSSNAKVRTD